MATKAQLDDINTMLASQKCSITMTTPDNVPLTFHCMPGEITFLTENLITMTGRPGTWAANPETHLTNLYSCGPIRLLDSTEKAVAAERIARAERKAAKEAEETAEENAEETKAPKKARKPKKERKPKKADKVDVTAYREHVVEQYPYDVKAADWKKAWEPVERDIDYENDSMEHIVGEFANWHNDELDAEDLAGIEEFDA